MLPLKAHAVSDRHHVDVPSLEGFRMALRVKRMGALAEEVVYLGNSSGRFLCGPFFSDSILGFSSQFMFVFRPQSDGAGGALPEIASPLPRGTEYKNPPVNLSDPKK